MQDNNHYLQAEPEAEPVDDVTRSQYLGQVQTSDWPMMMVARQEDALWVVFGSRRLKAMCKARLQG